MTSVAPPELAGVLLAAGGGRRMGQPKALVQVDGAPMVCRALDALADGGCDPVIVVIGAARAGVRAALDARGQPSADVVVVENAGWEHGQATSLRIGLQAAAARSPAAVLIHLVDLPDVDAAVIRRMREVWAAQRGRRWRAWAATYAGRRRNPVVLDAAVVGDVVAATSGDVGARRWLEAHADVVAGVPCDDLARPEDIDTPAELHAWITRHEAAAPGRGRSDQPSADVVASDAPARSATPPHTPNGVEPPVGEET